MKENFGELPMLCKIFGFTPRQISSLEETFTWLEAPTEQEDFLDAIEWYLSDLLRTTQSSLKETLNTVLPESIEGWISLYIEWRIPVYDVTYDYYTGGIKSLTVERSVWDEAYDSTRMIVIRYFDELVGDLESLKILDTVKRGKKEYTFVNGKLAP